LSLCRSLWDWPERSGERRRRRFHRCGVDAERPGHHHLASALLCFIAAT